MLLGIDIGTTHCKAALVGPEGEVVATVSRATPRVTDAEGYPVLDPEQLWRVVAGLVAEVTAGRRVRVVGITGMAEAGLLTDAVTGTARTAIIPWFDPRPVRQAAQIEERDTLSRLFARSGLRPSVKYGLAKILWLRAQQPALTRGARWLSVPDWIALRLTGVSATDLTLAARTYACDLRTARWDEEWLARFDLSAALFPPIVPSGAVMGTVNEAGHSAAGLDTGTPVALCGHDHLCALLAAGIFAPGAVLDSMGTAETLIGVLPTLDLGPEALRTGLAIVPHVLSGRWCWLGGLPSSGGAVEWLRAQWGEVSYAEFERLAAGAGPGPSGVVFLPYLQGRGAPEPNSAARGAFLGLSAGTSRGQLARAVLEGSAFEIEGMRQAAEPLAGAVERVVAVGGGVRNRTWLEIKAAVSGLVHHVPHLEEAAAQGAALLAGLSSGAGPTMDTLVTATARYSASGIDVFPDLAANQQYRRVFDTQYRPLSTALSRPDMKEMLVP